MPEAIKSLYRGHNPVDAPLYSMQDAIRYLRLSSRQLILPGKGDSAHVSLPGGSQNGHTGHDSNNGMISFRELVDLFILIVKEDDQLYKSRIEIEDGSPIRLYPFSRSKIDLQSPRIIAIDPRYGFGNPIIAKRNIRTDVVAGRFQAGEPISELASDLEIPTEEIEEAIRYESGNWT